MFVARTTNTQFAVAVHVLTYLAGEGGRAVGSEELAASTSVTAVHIRKVLGPLRTAGLVSSRPGAGGGWTLGRAPDDISLADVWTILQGDDPVLGLHGPNPACPVGRGVQAALVDVDRGVAEVVRRQLSGTTVADVVAGAIDAVGDGLLAGAPGRPR